MFPRLNIFVFLFAALIFLRLGSPNLTAQAVPAPVQNPPQPNTPPIASLSISSPSQLAEWQRRLTLGPGDVLDISLFDQADLLRTGLAVGPDGRLNYLEARDVMAAGLSVDELRTALEKILAKYYLSPRVIITPVAYNSKKYFVLGNVVQKGIFSLDRPLTVVEAIAKAQGFQVSLQQKNSLMLADLSRSFLIRKQDDGKFKQIAIDFEALFLRGDLSQNQLIAPDDYLYFPPLDLQEVYVVGRGVARPGPALFTEGLSALQAIAARGGFAEKAFKSRILVVRGSLTHPQTFIVNGGSVLRAKDLDFRLEARDIVYVHRRPWAKVEELLELAVTDFLRAAVITYTGQHIGPFINEPLF